MAFLAFALLAGVVTYGIVVARLGSSQRHDSRLWSVLSVGMLVLSLLLLTAYLVPASLGRSLDVDLVQILEAPFDHTPRYSGLYAAGYAGTSFGILAGIHRLVFARPSQAATPNDA